MVKKIDLYDKKILYELDKNSKQTVSQISKKIRLNPNTTHFRIERLISEGYIRSFYPIIDISRLGYFSVRVYFSFHNTKNETEEQIIQHLIKNECVAVVARLDTIYDVMISVIVKNIYEFSNFWNEFKSKYRKYIVDEKINTFSGLVYYQRKYLSSTKENIIKQTLGQEKIIEIDEEDKSIISVLSNNSRISSIEIYKKTGINPRTIINRINKLENEGIIQNYRVDIDIEKLGYKYYKINLKVEDYENIKNLVAFCEFNKNVVFVDYTIGEYDFEMDIEIDNVEALHKIINEIKYLVSVRSCEIMQFRKYYKITSVPRF